MAPRNPYKGLILNKSGLYSKKNGLIKFGTKLLWYLVGY